MYLLKNVGKRIMLRGSHNNEYYERERLYHDNWVSSLRRHNDLKMYMFLSTGF
jgi:hypothetical protein